MDGSAAALATCWAPLAQFVGESKRCQYGISVYAVAGARITDVTL